MSVAAPITPVESKKRPAWERLLALVVLILVIGAAANLLGWNIRGWFQELWDTLNEISIGYIIAGVALKTVQTTLTAFGWYSILKFAYPGKVRWIDVLMLCGVRCAQRHPAGQRDGCETLPPTLVADRPHDRGDVEDHDRDAAEHVPGHGQDAPHRGVHRID